MKKWIIIIFTLLITKPAVDQEVNQSFRIVYQVPVESLSCGMSVSENKIDGQNLPNEEELTASLHFNCHFLHKATVLVSSKNGGLQKGNDVSRIHYIARTNAPSLFPSPLVLDTETHGTEAQAGVFLITDDTVSITGKLSVGLKKNNGNSHRSGIYEDVLTVVFRPAPSS